MGDVAAIARSWLGTPYIGQASAKGVGTDCAGLIRGIWRELYGSLPSGLMAYPVDWGEGCRTEAVMSAASEYLPFASGPLDAGDILLFRMRSVASARHFGVLTSSGAAAGPPSFIHAFERHGVIESPLSYPWRRRLAARFRFPGR